MNYDRGFGFVGGLILGAIVGAAAALLLAPESGEETRHQLRAEGIALKNRSQEFGDETIHEAQRMVKQGKKGVSDAQGRIGDAIQDQKDMFQDAIDSGKQAASQRKEELTNRFQDVKTQVQN